MSICRISGIFGSILLGFISGVPLMAQETDLNKLTLVIKHIESDPVSKQQAITAGRERALLCSVCHGKDGNSVKPDVPNLAGQHTVYLLDQIQKFADGRRNNYVMNSLAKSFSENDKINLAMFYNSMPVKQVSVNKQLAVKGKGLYETQCSSCHGITGAGSASFARIAGQQLLYVSNTLKQFRDNANRTDNADKTGRSSAVMEPIVKGLSDRELENIAAYVTQLK